MKNVEHFKVDLSIVEFININNRIVAERRPSSPFTCVKTCVPNIVAMYRAKYSIEELLRCRNELVDMIEKRMHLISKAVTFIIDSFDELKGINPNDFESFKNGYFDLEDKKKERFFYDLEVKYVTDNINMSEGEWLLHEICRYNDHGLYEEGDELVDSWSYDRPIMAMSSYKKWLYSHRKRILYLFDLILNKEVKSEKTEEEVMTELIPEILQYKNKLLHFFFSLERAALHRRSFFLGKISEILFTKCIAYIFIKLSKKVYRYFNSSSISITEEIICMDGKGKLYKDYYDEIEGKLYKYYLHEIEGELYKYYVSEKAGNLYKDSVHAGKLYKECKPFSNYLQLVGWLLQCNFDRIIDNEVPSHFKFYDLYDFEREFNTVYIGKTNECGEVWLDYDEDIITLDYLKEYLRASLLVNLNLLGEYKQLDELCVF